MVSRGRPAAPLGRVARFSRYVLTERVLHVTVEPLVELDPYPIQYFFRSLYLDDATNDAELGAYDRGRVHRRQRRRRLAAQSLRRRA